MHGIYTNGHHLSLISGRRSENAPLNPITSPWQSPTAARRRRRREEDKEGEIKSSVESEEDGGMEQRGGLEQTGLWVPGRRWSSVQQVRPAADSAGTRLSLPLSFFKEANGGGLVQLPLAEKEMFVRFLHRVLSDIKGRKILQLLLRPGERLTRSEFQHFSSIFSLQAEFLLRASTFKGASE